MCCAMLCGACGACVRVGALVWVSVCSCARCACACVLVCLCLPASAPCHRVRVLSVSVYLYVVSIRMRRVQLVAGMHRHPPVKVGDDPVSDPAMEEER
jgi:hypothetical protein